MNPADNEFRPHSVTAMLATIVERQLVNSAKQDLILAHVEKTNGRVTRLETWKAVVNAQTVLIAGVAGGAVSLICWGVALYLKQHS